MTQIIVTRTIDGCERRFPAPDLLEDAKRAGEAFAADGLRVQIVTNRNTRWRYVSHKDGWRWVHDTGRVG